MVGWEVSECFPAASYHGGESGTVSLFHPNLLCFMTPSAIEVRRLLALSSSLSSGNFSLSGSHPGAWVLYGASSEESVFSTAAMAMECKRATDDKLVARGGERKR